MKASAHSSIDYIVGIFFWLVFFGFLSPFMLAHAGQPQIVFPKVVKEYTVVFTNTDPAYAYFGLAKFEIDENNQPVGYEVLHERWDEEVKTLKLEPGYYALTKAATVRYRLKNGRTYDSVKILGYETFWVVDRDLQITL